MARSERPLSSEGAPSKEVRPGDVGGVCLQCKCDVAGTIGSRLEWRFGAEFGLTAAAPSADCMWVGRDLLRPPWHVRAVGYSRSPLIGFYNDSCSWLYLAVVVVEHLALSFDCPPCRACTLSNTFSSVQLRRQLFHGDQKDCCFLRDHSDNVDCILGPAASQVRRPHLPSQSECAPAGFPPRAMRR